jgi:hypothetical protein
MGRAKMLGEGGNAGVAGHMKFAGGTPPVAEPLMNQG